MGCSIGVSVGVFHASVIRHGRFTADRHPPTRATRPSTPTPTPSALVSELLEHGWAASMHTTKTWASRHARHSSVQADCVLHDALVAMAPGMVEREQRREAELNAAAAKAGAAAAKAGGGSASSSASSNDAADDAIASAEKSKFGEYLFALLNEALEGLVLNMNVKLHNATALMGTVRGCGGWG